MSQKIDVSRISIPATDGLPLAGSLYEGSQPAARAVIICPAMGIARRHYDAYARFLCASGFSVVSFDYRGLGDSRPASLRHFPASMQIWGRNDIAGAIEWTRLNLQADKLMVVGHSAGGQLIGLADNASALTGLIQVTVPSGYWGHWPAPRRYAYALLWHAVMPGFASLLGYFPSRMLRLGDDLPKGVASEWARWCRHADYMFAYLDQHTIQRMASLDFPILSYSFSDDVYASRAAVDALLLGFPSAQVERKHLTPEEVGNRPVGHFGFFRDQFSDSLWRESAAWLNGL